MKRLVALMTLVVVTIWSAVVVLPDKNLHVVVCDVGQGDAILVSLGTTQMLVDGGPDDKVLKCLSQHMPFYDRRIEVVVLTHPQADHMNGLINVAERYDILYFVRGKQSNSTQGFEKLIKTLTEKKIKTVDVYAGNEIKLGSNLSFKIIWPTWGFVQTHNDKTTDLNSFATVGRIEYGQFRALLTADADSAVDLAEMATGLLTPVEVLKVPHHGSKTGMLTSWLRLVAPKAAIISVGRNNTYGHPGERTLKMLAKITDNVYRTDQRGSVEIVSDGERWWIVDK